ncbi:(p)ppGpp synthetase [Sinorhizobium meliloti]|uniref:GTP pyrophosphokinase n=1 Tax=Rhizobium meliloti TaxID=382 RepID=UPI000FD27762|nr:(p)ppGpp synthetase [Sinorhizobium meliloti]RVI10283.1 (p)ppGpp synthetase [Sinorhizobium meliloti]RVN77723.1 (p)ppGpp synthetase [Sinorhizobium meliloti]RVO03641.1 (p)ppGpp synthetase [Sinorhizobium meliloti]
MASQDYETEKVVFRDFYDASWDTMEAARNAFLTLVRSLLATDAAIAGAKVEGRIKEREECLSKFRLKYQTGLESSKTPYAIRDHISDLIGLRIVCFYEDDVERVKALISAEFDVLGVTDKTAQMEETADAFGYKGLHLDLRLNDGRRTLKEYAAYAEYPFELQIRTVVQDSWSILDHKIKYKKSIPNGLKRRINTLAALFELADREFRAIRDGTAEEIERTDAYAEIEEESTVASTEPEVVVDAAPRKYAPLNAFSLLRIAKHFFPGQDFEPHKVDGFTQQVIDVKPDISRGKFNFYLRETISEVRRYKADFEARPDGTPLNPFTIMRHCLYAADPDVFASILTDRARESFDAWREENKPAREVG